MKIRLSYLISLRFAAIRNIKNAMSYKVRLTLALGKIPVLFSALFLKYEYLKDTKYFFHEWHSMKYVFNY